MKLAGLVGLAVVCAGVAGARGAVVLDAHYNPADTTFVAAVAAPPNYVTEDTAQTLTVEHTGTLVQLDLLLERGVNSGTPTGNLHWAVWPVAGGLPNETGAALASGDIAASGINADAPAKIWVNIGSLNLPVTVGQSLAIVLHNNGTNYFGWGSDAGNPYVGGVSLDRQNGVWTAFSSFDQAFALHVNTVPEPGTVGILAVAGVMVVRRRRGGV